MVIHFSRNPLNVEDDLTKYVVKNGLSPNQVLDEIKVNLVRPTILLVEGVAWGRVQWDEIIPEDNHVLFVELPQNTAVIAIIAIVVALGSLVYSLVMSNKYKNSGSMYSMDAPEEVFSFSQGRSQIRIGQPFVEHFGRQRFYLDFIQQPHVQFIDNEQYLYFVGVVGVGKYYIEEVYLDNTPLLDFEDCAFHEAYSEADTLEHYPFLYCKHLVWTCNAVSNQELGKDWITFTLSPPRTVVYEIEYDIVLPRGLATYDDNGKPSNADVATYCYVRLIDDNENALTDWEVLSIDGLSDSTNNPIRKSYKRAPPFGPGRYQVQLSRGKDPSESSKLVDNIILTGLRGYGAKHPYDLYGDITVITGKIKATNQLSGAVISKVNVIATRKLGRVTTTGIDSTPVATRSIIDAVGYLLTADNCGQQSPDLIDWETLASLRDELENSDVNYHFDYRFKSRMSVMDAVATCAACCRAVPCMPGGKFTLIQDSEDIDPSLVLTKDNILSQRIITRPRNADSPTCMEITYVDSEAWHDEIVYCLDSDSDYEGSINNPAKITLLGCTDRQHAYEIGMYLFYQEHLERTVIEVVTNAMGFLPQIMDKIIVPNSMTNWGTSGLLMAVDGLNLWLSEPVDFEGYSTGLIYIVFPSGAIGNNPYTVTDTGDPYHVIADASFPGANNFEINDIKGARYLFGVSSDEKLVMRISSIKPQGRDKVQLTGIAVNTLVYQDPGNAPDIDETVSTNELLNNVNLVYTGTLSSSNEGFTVSWSGAAEAVKVEINQEGAWTLLEDWLTDYTFDYELYGKYGHTIRVTPYDGSDLELEKAIIADFEFRGQVSGLSCTPSKTGLEISWNNVSSAESYSININFESGEASTGNVVETNGYNLSMNAMEVMGGPWPEFTITVMAIFDLDSDNTFYHMDKGELDVIVDALSAPAMTRVLQEESDYTMFSWDEVDGATKYIVCYSTTVDSNFDFECTEENIEVIVMNNSAIISKDFTSGNHYFKIAAQQYGHDISELNFTEVLEIYSGSV